MLNERFMQIDFEQAKEDVMPFVKNAAFLEVWNSEFFRAITETITCE